ncbi:hypothetical protein [Geodermatophilus sp. SYSU D00815]
MHARFMNPRVVTAVAAVVALGSLLLYYLDFDLLAQLTTEDGVYEYLQALCYLLAAVAFVVAAVRRRTPWLWAAPLAVLSVLVAGEEVSWGQRIFGISTPEELDRINEQGEFNLHNIEGIHENIRLIAFLFLCAAFVAYPVAVRRLAPVRRLATRLRAPVPDLSASILAVLGLLFMVVPRIVADGVSFQLDEVGELYVAAAWFAFAAVTAAAVRPAARTATTGARALAR